MLQSLLEFYENHPYEDVHTLSLMVVGILKAVAILKSVSVLLFVQFWGEVGFSFLSH